MENTYILALCTADSILNSFNKNFKMSYLTRKEIDEMKPQIEKAVNKFLGFGEPAIVTTAVNCITSGYDKRKTAGKNDKMCYIHFNVY